ncbi:hypothetical protein OS128_05315 [Corynebacterium sp. P5848]|uniref:hypothetical protein n=1 Tax=Corynebacterium marambiense TaxID=2765364 RepID=UPI002260D42E|nr:hypothetical protein [Corynebacterium marambiense]MCX7542330.1 hypothetical protein [Corynebacterium marambiense]
MDSIEQWFSETSGGDSQRQVAINSGVPIPTLARQMREGTLSVDTVVKISRAYQVSAIPPLMHLGVLTEEDVQMFAAGESLADASDEALAGEVLRRMKLGSDLMDAPISTVRERLGAIHTIHGDVDPAELEGLPYAASDAPDEPGPGDEGYHDGP